MPREPSPDPNMSANKILAHLADLERMNHSRLLHRREDALTDHLVPILESLHLYRSFKKLVKHMHILKGKEVAIMLMLRKR
jgi:hypothetical protein